MRKIAIMAAFVLSIVFILAFSASAFAVTAPHGGYGSTTDFCISCHDIHEANGDYVLTRESTVTAVCGTCHGVFGASAAVGVYWSNPPANFAGADPTASTKRAYTNGFSAGMTGPQQDAVPGHSLGVMMGGTVVRSSDIIPGSSATLKIMTSGQYGGPSEGLYGGTTVTTYNGTKGLYCASCHTPHANARQMIPGTKLLSAKPNHSLATPVTDEYSFCVSCHDKRDNVGVEKNHPAQAYCLTCHANQASGGVPDFPHSSTNTRILYAEPDALCLLCHSAGTLP
ncbi:MAG: cytochrome c3 family protein [Thermoleophilia bacterium]